MINQYSCFKNGRKNTYAVKQQILNISIQENYEKGIKNQKSKKVKSPDQLDQ